MRNTQGTVRQEEQNARACLGPLRPPPGDSFHKRAPRTTYADPWMLQGFMGCDAFGRVNCQHLVDEVFGFRSDSVPFGGWELQKEGNDAQAKADTHSSGRD